MVQYLAAWVFVVERKPVCAIQITATYAARIRPIYEGTTGYFKRGFRLDSVKSECASRRWH